MAQVAREFEKTSSDNATPISTQELSFPGIYGAVMGIPMLCI